jgi:prefoldin subunit 5
VLALTKSVADARSQLAELEKRQRELSDRLTPIGAGADSQEVSADPVASDEIRRLRDEVQSVSGEITRLNLLINEASEQAARTIQTQHGSAR